MSNPFQSSSAVSINTPTPSFAVTALLALLATITAYLLWGDVNYLLAAQKGTLTRAGSVSFLHHMYLTTFALEIAYFRLTTSASIFIFVVFSMRNSQAFSSHIAPVYLYGLTQLAFYILSMTAILGILNQISDYKLLEIFYWSGHIASEQKCCWRNQVHQGNQKYGCSQRLSCWARPIKNFKQLVV